MYYIRSNNYDFIFMAKEVKRCRDLNLIEYDICILNWKHTLINVNGVTDNFLSYYWCSPASIGIEKGILK